MKRWNLALIPTIALVAWAATAQVAPTIVVSLALNSVEDLEVVHNILEETLPSANQAFQHGPLSGEIRRIDHGTDRFYNGQFAFGSLLKPVERIVFSYKNITSPAIVGQGLDQVRFKYGGSVSNAPDGRFVIWSEDSYDFTLHVLSNLPAEVETLFNDGFTLTNFLAYPGTAAASTFTPHVEVIQLRFTDGVSSRTLNISASATSSGFGPLQVQN